MVQPPQIPFDFFAPSPATFESFVVGDNAELVTSLYALTNASAQDKPTAALALWGGPSVGKSHLLAATALAANAGAPGTVMSLAAGDTFPSDPFVPARMICVDDADRLNAEQQGWLFTAFNHIAPLGGTVIVSGHTPPARWPLRDDLRTRLGSGLIFEVVSIPQDALPVALAEHAARRGFQLGDEVLTYILSRASRDVATLWQIVRGIDALSLARKRAVTVPLLREYLARNTEPGSQPPNV